MSVDTAPSTGATFEASVAGEIRAEIARQRLNNRKVGELMGRNHFWVGDRLNGRTHIEVGDLAEFAAALDVPVEQFVRRQGLEPRTQCFGRNTLNSSNELARIIDLDAHRRTAQRRAVA